MSEIVVDDRGTFEWLEIRFDYNRDAVRDIKKIPHERRSWDPDERVWTVHPDYRQRVRKLARDHFDGGEWRRHLGDGEVEVQDLSTGE